MKKCVMALTAVAVMVTASSALAHPRETNEQFVPRFGLGDSGFNERSGYRDNYIPTRSSRHRTSRAVSGGAIIPHPAGCPRQLFCACGAAVRIFGAPLRSLWAAAAWFKFPRAAPAPGMVAVRRHHVFVLEQHIEGSTWLVTDYNSGRHLSRRHHRSIAGLTIVNPRS